MANQSSGAGYRRDRGVADAIAVKTPTFTEAIASTDDRRRMKPATLAAPGHAVG
jgi:hypothetical protein